MDPTTILASAALMTGISPALLQAVCWQESKHQPKAIHRDDGGSDSVGLCQIKLSTARMFEPKVRYEELFDAATNARIAAKYLARQLKRFPNNLDFAIAAYNSGTPKFSKSLTVIPSKLINSTYVTKVQDALEAKPWKVKQTKSKSISERSTKLKTSLTSSGPSKARLKPSQSFSRRSKTTSLGKALHLGSR